MSFELSTISCIVGVYASVEEAKNEMLKIINELITKSLENKIDVCEEFYITDKKTDQEIFALNLDQIRYTEIKCESLSLLK